MRVKCDVCGGTGTYYCSSWSFDGDSDRMIPDGPLEEVACENCEDGWIEGPEEVLFDYVPAVEEAAPF